jgi:hypothetical protein
MRNAAINREPNLDSLSLPIRSVLAGGLKVNCEIRSRGRSSGCVLLSELVVALLLVMHPFRLPLHPGMRYLPIPVAIFP